MKTELLNPNMAALWTEVCLTFPAHNAAMRRIEQAGVAPATALQVLLEYQRDKARKDTCNALIEVVKEHCGAYGQGVEYACTMARGAPASRAGAAWHWI